MRTVEQERAKHAYDRVQSERQKEAADLETWKKFKTATKQLPATIQTNGLLQALAFYGKDEKKKTRTFLEEWLGGRPAFRDLFANPGDLAARLAEQDLETYRRVRSEAMAYATWLKRAAESLG